ncbi:MAG: hypothetical protein SWX82_02520 [Cyanobacteriota bacterium]|nr:hypothetical protein [Cyanobacteriota bacterium]
MPRDWNGALGIFLKALRSTPYVDGSAVTLLWFSLLLQEIAGVDVSELEKIHSLPGVEYVNI